MKFDWEVHDPALIKVVGQSASGKSVKVEVSINRYDDSIHAFEVETIRMDNLQGFINREISLRDRVESELDQFVIAQGVL
jgi:ABC-type dipeptide/oligopeptide/nickel transport system ATPase component